MKYENVVRFYKTNGSMKDTARKFGVSESVVRKCLITEGLLTSPLIERIAKLTEDGMSSNEIMKELGISSTCLGANRRYIQGGYLSDEKSQNAIKLAKWKAKKRCEARFPQR